MIRGKSLAGMDIMIETARDYEAVVLEAVTHPSRTGEKVEHNDTVRIAETGAPLRLRILVQEWWKLKRLSSHSCQVSTADECSGRTAAHSVADLSIGSVAITILRMRTSLSSARERRSLAVPPRVYVHLLTSLYMQRRDFNLLLLKHIMLATFSSSKLPLLDMHNMASKVPREPCQTIGLLQSHLTTR